MRVRRRWFVPLPSRGHHRSIASVVATVCCGLFFGFCLLVFTASHSSQPWVQWLDLLLIASVIGWLIGTGGRFLLVVHPDGLTEWFWYTYRHHLWNELRADTSDLPRAAERILTPRYALDLRGYDYWRELLAICTDQLAAAAPDSRVGAAQLAVMQAALALQPGEVIWHRPHLRTAGRVALAAVAPLIYLVRGGRGPHGLDFLEANAWVSAVAGFILIFALLIAAVRVGMSAKGLHADDGTRVREVPWATLQRIEIVGNLVVVFSATGRHTCNLDHPVGRRIAEACQDWLAQPRDTGEETGVAVDDDDTDTGR